MQRRSFLAGVGAGAVGGLTGCLGYRGGDDALTVATYTSFVEGDDPIGPWLKDAFEDSHDGEVTVEYETPSAGLNQYIRRAQQDADLEADLYVGLNVDHLIRVDEQLDEPLFDALEGDLPRSDQIREELRFDPEGRAVPYDTGYISLVYDESEVEPATFDDLIAEETRGELLTQNAQQANTGRAFLLWTVHEFGPDSYLEYWEALEDNDVRIVGSWSDSYNLYLNEEASMVVSYSTDQVFASQETDDLTRHQVAFLNDQGYANPEGMARFTGADSPELAAEFMAFILEPDVQGEVAMRNVQFPAVDDAELDPEFEQYAHVPPDPVTFAYDELAGNVDDWIEAWARQIAE